MNDDVMGTLKSMLGDGAEDKINSVLKLFKNDGEKEPVKVDDEIKIKPPVKSSEEGSVLSDDGIMYLTKIKSIVDEMGRANDPRSRLLLALKPYMRQTRQKSIDNAVKLLNLSRIAVAFLGR